MPSSAPRVKDVFDRAVELESPAERIAYLDEACASAPEIRQKVEALLRAYAEAGNFLEPDATAGGMTNATGTFAADPATKSYDPDGTVTHGPSPGGPRLSPAPGLGTVIAGRYSLVEVIGEGGMGSVYRASQTEPVKRQVALKLIKTGMDSKSVLARFDAERQALAMMDHPNIARIYDGGVTPSGQPFFVMELVKGVPLTEYCDAKRLTVDARLQLFVQVCQAVQHAHQKGIIHRDLKPGNVLVTEVDGRPTPKVIDFGVAKATEQKLTDQSFSDTGAIVGTPAYMSPEQADPSSMDIDTRTDVYALGVMLYELLTGSPPIDSKQFKRGAILEMLRMVREVEPPRPSTKLSTADALPNIAANRSIEPAKLSRLLQGELDWVVMKALEKDRTRRYETANGLARDIQRYIADEVVEARPPSTGYRMKKFVKRHKGQMIAASVVFLALVAGVFGTTYGLFRAEENWKKAEVNYKLAETKRAEAEQQKVRAIAGENLANVRLAQVEEEKKISEGIRFFLQQKLLRQADPKRQADDLLRSERRNAIVTDNPTIRELLDRTAKELSEDTIEMSFPKQPLVQASILKTVGDTYWGIGDYDKAIGFLTRSCDLFKRELGAEDSSTLISQSNLAWAFKDAGRLKDSIALFEAVRDARLKLFGDDDPETISTLGGLAFAYQEAGRIKEAIALYERVRDGRVKQLGDDHPTSLTTRCNLAVAYMRAGRLKEATELSLTVRDAQEKKLGADHPSTLITINNLGLLKLSAGEHREAIDLFKTNLSVRTIRLGAEHPETLTSMNNLANAYSRSGRPKEALELLEQIRDIEVKKYGEVHPRTLITRHNLATMYSQNPDRLNEAINLFEKVRDAQMNLHGPEHPATLSSLNGLAVAYQRIGRMQEALPLFETVCEARKKILGAEHEETLITQNNLAVAYRKTGRLKEAIELFIQVRDTLTKQFGANHPMTLTTLGNLGSTYWDDRQLEKSLPLFEDLLKRQEAKLGRTHPDTQLTVANLGVNYKDSDRLAEAIPLLEEAYQASRKYPRLRWVESSLLNAYKKTNAGAQAGKIIQTQLTDSRKNLPKDSPQLAGTLAQAGMLLMELQQWGEAEPILRESLGIRQKIEPDAWTSFNTQSLLGASLLGQKKYADAEPLLIGGYEGMKKREKVIPSQGDTRIPEALDRLIELYTVTNKSEEVKKWRAERAKYPILKEVPPPPLEKK